MQMYLIIGAAVVALGAIVLAIIVSLAKSKGSAEAQQDATKAFNDRRRDADEVLTEPVADEKAWIELQQLRAAAIAPGAGDAARDARFAARRKLRELQRRTGRNPG